MTRPAQLPTKKERAPKAIAALDRALRELMWHEHAWLKACLREFELDIPPFIVLGHLASLGSQATIAALVEQLDQRNTTMTGHLDRLEDKGLVTRRFGSPEDRRKVIVRLTPKGKEFLKRVKHARHEHLRRQAAHLSDAETRKLIALLQRYLENVEKKK